MGVEIVQHRVILPAEGLSKEILTDTSRRSLKQWQSPLPPLNGENKKLLAQALK